MFIREIYFRNVCKRIDVHIIPYHTLVLILPMEMFAWCKKCKWVEPHIRRVFWKYTPCISENRREITVHYVLSSEVVKYSIRTIPRWRRPRNQSRYRLRRTRRKLHWKEHERSGHLTFWKVELHVRASGLRLTTIRDFCLTFDPIWRFQDVR